MLTWLAAITNGALWYLYRRHTHISGLPLLRLIAVIVAAERLHGILTSMMQLGFSMKLSEAELAAKHEEYQVRTELVNRYAVKDVVESSVNVDEVIMKSIKILQRHRSNTERKNHKVE